MREAYQYDRVIEMGEHFQYAVVLPSYYGDHATRHKMEGAAIAGYRGVTILNREGEEMLVHPGISGYHLVKA